MTRLINRLIAKQILEANTSNKWIFLATKTFQTINFLNRNSLIFINTRAVTPLLPDQKSSGCVTSPEGSAWWFDGIIEFGGDHVFPAQQCPSRRLSPLGDGAE
jgi:hypothetical protein